MLVSFVLSVVLVSPVAARVESEMYDDSKPTSKDLKPLPLVEQRKRENTVQSNKNAIKILTEESKRKIEENKEALKTSLEQKREEFKNSLEQKRAEVKEKIETKKTELKEQLTKIKDGRKKEIVERANSELNKINERRTNHFSEVLEHLDTVLLNISSRADKAESRGLNVSAVRAAILGAQGAIATSREAVKTQASKVYSISISTESALRNDTLQARKTLRDDLMKVQETVKSAREAVRQVLVTLAQIPRVNDDNPTPSPTSTE